MRAQAGILDARTDRASEAVPGAKLTGAYSTGAS